MKCLREDRHIQMEEEIASRPTSIFGPRFLGAEFDCRRIAPRWANAVLNRLSFSRRLLHVLFLDSAPDVHGTSNPGHHLDPPFDELRLEIPCETDLQARLQGAQEQLMWEETAISALRFA